MKRFALATAVLAALIFVSCEEEGPPRFDITFEPSDLDFGKVENWTEVDTMITITNPSSSTGDFIGILEVMDTPGFNFDHPREITILRGESKSIKLTFMPTALQKYEGRFTLINEERDLDYFYELPLKGEGVGPVRFGVVSPALKFGLVSPDTHKDLNLTVQNYVNSGFDLEISLSIPSGDFTLPDGQLNYTIPINQSVDIPVRYTPNSLSSSGTIDIFHNSSQGDNPLSISLTGTKDLTEDVKSDIADGWSFFQAGDYTSALVEFQSAMKIVQSSELYGHIHGDALLGRGWTYAFLREYENSRIDFEKALEDFLTEPSQSRLDVVAGLTLVDLLLARYNQTIEHASYVLSESPNYMFTYKNTIDHKDIRLARAQAYFNSGDYSSAAGDLDILDPDGTPHSTDPRDLIQALQNISGTF